MAVNHPLHLLFVDLEKAYDSVLLENLWKVLEHYNIMNRIIKAIKRLYENSFSKIKIGKQLSSGFYITKGQQHKDVVYRPLYLKHIFRRL